MPFIATKSVMFVRNTPARTTSSKLLLAAFRTADRFWKMRSVSGTMPRSPTLPLPMKPGDSGGERYDRAQSDSGLAQSEIGEPGRKKSILYGRSQNLQGR